MKNIKTIGAAALTILMLIIFAQIPASAQDNDKQDQNDELIEGGLFPVGRRPTEKTLVGVWRTLVTPRDCETGVPAPFSLRGLFTFNEGGTMSEYGIAPGQTPALRSPGHGIWKINWNWRREGDYTLSFIFLRYDSSGTFIGSNKVTAALNLARNQDDFTTNSVVEVLDANDNLVGTFCANAAGTRFR